MHMCKLYQALLYEASITIRTLYKHGTVLLPAKLTRFTLYFVLHGARPGVE